MQAGQQSEGDILADPALVLLSLPVEFEGTDSTEFGQNGPEDLQVQNVAAVDPDADKRAEVRRDDYRVEVVEGFGCLN